MGTTILMSDSDKWGQGLKWGQSESRYNLLFHQHSDAVHKEKKKFKCTICDKVFSQKRDLNRHIELVHEGGKPFKCNNCVFNSKTKSQ